MGDSSRRLSARALKAIFATLTYALSLADDGAAAYVTTHNKHAVTVSLGIQLISSARAARFIAGNICVIDAFDVFRLCLLTAVFSATGIMPHRRRCLRFR